MAVLKEISNGRKKIAPGQYHVTVGDREALQKAMEVANTAEYREPSDDDLVKLALAYYTSHVPEEIVRQDLQMDREFRTRVFDDIRRILHRAAELKLIPPSREVLSAPVPSAIEDALGLADPMWAGTPQATKTRIMQFYVKFISNYTEALKKRRIAP